MSRDIDDIDIQSQQGDSELIRGLTTTVVPFNHDSIYSNFHTLAQSIRAFLQSGNFGEIYRNPPGTTDEASHT